MTTMADVGKPERRVIVIPEERPVMPQPEPVKAPEKEPA
jgi:hypothetical protein